MNKQKLVRKFKRWSRQNQLLKQSVIFAAILLVGGGAGYLTLNGWESKNVVPDHLVEEKKSLDHVSRLLEAGTARESIDFANSIRPSLNEPLPIQIKKHEDRIALASSALEVRENDDEKIKAELLMIGSLHEIEKLLVSNGSLDVNRLLKLEAYAGRYLSDESDELTLVSNSAWMFANLLHLAVHSDSQDISLDKIRNQMVYLHERFPGDTRVVKELITQSNQLKKLRFTKFSNDLLQTIGGVFGDASNRTIRAYGQLATIQAHANELGLGVDFSEGAQLQQNLAAKNIEVIRDQIKKLAATDISKNELEQNQNRLMNHLVHLMQSGANQSLDDMLAIAQPVLLPNLSERTGMHFSEIKLIKNSIGRKLDISKEVNTLFQQTTGPFVLVFAKGNTSEKARLHGIRQIHNLLERCQPLTIDNHVQLLVVYLAMDEKEPYFEALQRVADNTKILKLDPDLSSSFLKRFPVFWGASWVLLDNEKNLRVVNPPISILEYEIAKILEESNN